MQGGLPIAALVVVLLGMFGVFLYVVVTFNRFVRYGKTMGAALSDIDVFLKKRYDLVPRLVDTVKGYTAHEKEALTKVTEMRARHFNTETVPGKAELHGTLKAVVGSLFAVAEDYPDLKADKGFLQLQDELVKLEDDIEKARRYYNAVVRDNNILCDSFPSNAVRAIFRFKEGEFFESAPGERSLEKPLFGRAGEERA